jgi:hypothetical protein
MKTLIKRLPVFAFILAAFAAFAFTPAASSEYGLDGEDWIEVTELTPGPLTYQCNSSTTQVCTRELPNDNAPQVKPGIL